MIKFSQLFYAKNNRNFICYTNKIFVSTTGIPVLFSTTSRYQPMSMFNVKNEIWDSTETKDTPYLIFTSRSDTVPHPAMVNMTHNTKNNRSHLILILFPPQNSMSQYNNVYTKKRRMKHSLSLLCTYNR